MYSYSEQIKGELDAFLLGIKDVIWESDTYIINELIKKKYYRKKMIGKWTRNGTIFYWFFKTKESKRQFIENGLYEKLMTLGISYCHDEVGKLLGFPPKAVDYFTNKNEYKTTTENIYINFCGMYFASYPSTIKDDFKWLLDNKPLINGKTIVVGNDSVIIGESEWLEKLHNIINKKVSIT